MGVRARAHSSILAVDAVRGVRRLVRVILVRAGYQVSTASNGAEALQQAKGQQPETVVVAGGPSLTEEVVSALQSDRETEGIPVVTLEDFLHGRRPPCACKRERE